ncbi:MAG TPA: tRNA (adenosine(37)-N6)-dimethylallyltransferase MiaA [Lichenihabitans sp.]|jgi:tRNA dimethylallyltransferase|nr:tRNA (adenosine(37)-N6)-dimethylallyltransferase MiaA [Lichenihabitans sp.]
MASAVIGTGRLQQTAILIAGPTASGKSALALRLAERLGGEIVNADSMAVYRDLAILTGRPTPEDLGRAPHRLYGHVDAAEAYSVGRWLGEASDALAAVRQRARRPIVVGGTGLYFKALTQGLSDIPMVPDAVRTRLRGEAEGMSPEALHARLAALDPETAARLRPSDPQRILRALEVFAATGRPLARFQAERSAPLLAKGLFTGLVIAPEREVLRGAIDRRFDAMMAAGALGEVAALRVRKLDPALPAMRALGVPPLLAHLDGAMSLDEAVRRAKAQTRAYAKRQITFARHQLPGWIWAAPEEAEHAAAVATADRL